MSSHHPARRAIFAGMVAGSLAALAYVGAMLIRRGQLPPFARRIALLQNLSRHLVFGLVLGESQRMLKRQAFIQR